MKESKEIWRPVKHYESKYEISNKGRVKSLSRKLKRKGGTHHTSKEFIMRPRVGIWGYKYLSLYKDSKEKTHKVHQMVAVAFLGHVPNGYKGLVVDHIDHEKLNNNLENLRLVTARDNQNKSHLKSSSKYVGVSFHRLSNKWQSAIFNKGKKNYLGLYINEEDARDAYNDALSDINKLLKQLK